MLHGGRAWRGGGRAGTGGGARARRPKTPPAERPAARFGARRGRRGGAWVGGLREAVQKAVGAAAAAAVALHGASAPAAAVCGPAAPPTAPSAAAARAAGPAVAPVGFSVPQLLSATPEGAEDGPFDGDTVVDEAWSVVDEHFLDARGNKYSPEFWRDVKERTLRSAPFTSRREAYAAIRSMLAQLDDQFTRFVTPTQFAALTKYDITGVGLNIGEGDKPGELVVLGLILEGEASRAGVEQGDRLVTVDGEPVDGMSPFDASTLMVGNVGAPLVLTVAKGASDAPEALREYTMTRTAEAPASPVEARLEREGGGLGSLSLGSSGGDKGIRDVGYLRLREFNSRAQRDLRDAIARLEDQGAQALVLDLRDNPGGLVSAGVEVARLFLDEGSTIVKQEGRADGTAGKQVVTFDEPSTRLPLMVLVNGRTASASEIVTGALRDNCRGVVVGSRTYGKGLIQSVYELADGSGIVITVGKYVTPAGIDIDAEGISPDLGERFGRPGFGAAGSALKACEAVPKVARADLPGNASSS